MEEITNNNDTLEKQPLVSIIVITYNSAKYVLETLESAKAQTYQNIELIVSDNCSTDLNPDSILSCTSELLDFKMLFQPFEKNICHLFL